MILRNPQCGKCSRCIHQQRLAALESWITCHTGENVIVLGWACSMCGHVDAWSKFLWTFWYVAFYSETGSQLKDILTIKSKLPTAATVHTLFRPTTDDKEWMFHTQHGWDCSFNDIMLPHLNRQSIYGQIASTPTLFRFILSTMFLTHWNVCSFPKNCTLSLFLHFGVSFWGVFYHLWP